MKTALVGCGRWGTKLLGALLRHGGFELVTVADIAADARQRAEALVPSARVCCTLEEALDAKPAAVIVATPSELHVAHGLQAIAAGADVLVEKPMALSSADARRLCDAARESERVGIVGHLLRYHPPTERLIESIRAGVVGPPELLVAWRLTQSGSPAPLWTLGPHDLTTLRALDRSPVVHVHARELPAKSLERGARSVTGQPLEPPVRALSRKPRAEPNPAAGWGIELQVQLESGLVALLRLSTRARAPARMVRVEGRRGVLTLDELDPLEGLELCPTQGIEATRLEVGAGEPLLRELDHFHECVRLRQAPRTSFERSLWVVELLEQAERSLHAPAALRLSARALAL